MKYMFSPGLQRSGGVIMSVWAGIRESPSQFENRIMPLAYTRSTMYQKALFR